MRKMGNFGKKQSRSDLLIRQDQTLTVQFRHVILNLFQNLFPLNLNDNREISPTGQTNIDRSQSTRQTGSHNSPARWFALSIKFGMTQSGDDNGCNVTKDNDMTPTPSRHPELVSGSKNNNRRVAFTLAEVLITLGIIGVVAAMTLPTLIHKYQAKVFEARFKKSVAVITEIINRTKYNMGIENLGEYCAYYNGSEYVNATECMLNINNNIIALKKPKKDRTYYNIVRNPNDIYTYNGKNNVELSSNELAIFNTNELKDGTFLGYYYGSGLSFVVDLNGYGKPNRLGYDIFIFSVSKDVNSKLVKYTTFYPTYNNNLTDEQITQKWEDSTLSTKNYYMNIEGYPCNKTSTRAGNGIGCAYYALKNECPDDSTKTYWECLPR